MSASKKRPWRITVNAFEEAAATVLKRARRPLTIQEITERMISLALVKPSGRTPERSLYTIILRANRRRERKGDPPRFIAHRNGNRVRYRLYDQ